ncbi:hypothetical protein AE621_26030 [Acidovorax sp. SD340]|nr:hypothetical protein AE621_26030 [Acidovorax sp. SD340]
MATSPQVGLNPASRDDGRTMLGTLEFAAGGDVELVEVGRAEVGQGMPLEQGSQELHGIEIRRVRRKERHLDITTYAVQMAAHELAAMRLQTVPDDQQRPLQVRPQRLEELDMLLVLDRALVQPGQARVGMSPAMTQK